MKTPNANTHDEFELLIAGKFAHEIIEKTGTGQVTAIFKRSIYINLCDDLICLGGNSLALGPLNIQTNLPKTMDWEATGIRLNDRVHNSAHRMTLGNLLSFSSRKIKVWVPQKNIYVIPSKVQAGLKTLLILAQKYFPIEGLASLVLYNDKKTKILDIAKPAIDDLSDIFRLRVFDKSVNSLIGLGPGLTPSGDDFLVGMLVTLNSLGEKKLLELLEKEINSAVSRTNDISKVHLKAASRGFGAEPLHSVIRGIVNNDTEELRKSLKNIDNIGHCSGWDALTGIFITLKAWLKFLK
tara:strand:- start:379 stop:1266 length:888 start_codon:yes stop_codon:yes gene_type:complete